MLGGGVPFCPLRGGPSHCSGRFGSAGWSFSAGARRRRTVPRRVTLMLVLCVRAYDGLVEAVAWGGQVPEAFEGEVGPVLL